MQNCDFICCFVLVFEKKVPKKIFRTKKEKLAGEWRELHSRELH